MDIAVDTDLVAYALLGEPVHGPEAIRVLRGADGIIAPDLLHAEMTNVCWQWVRSGRTSLTRALTALDDVEALLTETVPARNLAAAALWPSVATDHASYDTLLVALALDRQIPLITYDRALISTFCDATMTAATFLDHSS